MVRESWISCHSGWRLSAGCSGGEAVGTAWHATLTARGRSGNQGARKQTVAAVTWVLPGDRWPGLVPVAGVRGGFLQEWPEGELSKEAPPDAQAPPAPGTQGHTLAWPSPLCPDGAALAQTQSSLAVRSPAAWLASRHLQGGGPFAGPGMACLGSGAQPFPRPRPLPTGGRRGRGAGETGK